MPLLYGQECMCNTYCKECMCNIRAYSIGCSLLVNALNSRSRLDAWEGDWCQRSMAELSGLSRLYQNRDGPDVHIRMLKEQHTLGLGLGLGSVEVRGRGQLVDDP